MAEVSKDFANGFGVLDGQGLVGEVKGHEIVVWLQNWIEVVSGGGPLSKQVVDLNLLQLTTLLGHVVHSLDPELEEVRANTDQSVAMQLDGSQVGKLGHENHDPVVVGLQLRLVQNWDAQNFLRGTNFVDIVVEDGKVEELVEVLQHLLETELVEQVAPVEFRRVVFVDFLTADL